MIAGWPKFVAVLLAVTFTGAAHVCLCAGMGEKAAASATSTDPHACCKQGDEQAPAAPADEDPCENCNAQHPLTITVPEKASVAPAPAVIALYALESPFAQVFVGLANHPSTDDVPIPPLLRDLVHTSCQLTV